MSFSAYPLALQMNVPTVGYESFPSVLITRRSIQNMPDDVLINIFKIVLLDYQRDATFKTVFRDAGARVKKISVLLALSRVCKAWNATIRAYPAFWTRADGHQGELLTRVLARAGSFPLSLFVTSELEGLLDLLVSYGPRIKRLDMAIAERGQDIGNLSFVNGNALECFTLTYEDFGTGLQRASPFLLFGERILPLKALSIAPFTGRFPSNHFPNLTHLHLVLRVAWSVDNLPRPLSTSFFDLLSNTPKLEFLTVVGIGNLLEGFSSHPVVSGVPVALSNIRSLVFVQGGMKTMCMVLARLVLPQTALVRLQGVQVPTPDAPALPQLIALQSIDRLHIATEDTCLQLVAEGASSGLWLQGLIEDKGVTESEDGQDGDDESDDRGEDEDEDDIATEDEVEPGDDDAWSWRRWLATLPGYFPLARVTKLEIYIGPHHTILSTLLPHMVGLIDLSVCLNRGDEQRGADPQLSLARVLYKVLAKMEPLLCPDLQVLNLDVDGIRPGTVPDLYPEEMKRMIISRSSVGHPINRVIIQPFADANMIQAALFDDVAGRFDKLSTVVEDLEVKGPGIPAIPVHDAIWERWSVDGIDKFWEIEWLERVSYTTPWDF